MSDPCPIEREHEEYAEFTDLDGATRFCPRCGMCWEGGNGKPVTVTAYPVASACERVVAIALSDPEAVSKGNHYGIKRGGLTLSRGKGGAVTLCNYRGWPTQVILRRGDETRGTAEALCERFLAAEGAKPE
jgi:hypothetical protein